jgi:isoquinoline 1-oxidoreductase beta subunit
MNQHSSVNRRDFLGSAAGLTLALTILPERFAGLDEAVADVPLSPNAWLTITPDGMITIVSPAAEMGQGTFTTIPAIVADELDADWSKVKPVLPPAWEEKKYGNPEYGMNFQTSASASVRGYFKPLRIAGAQARRVLLDAVAAKWSVPLAELSTEPSVVVHKASGRRISYGEIAAFAKAPAELPKIEDKDLKDPATFRYIGKDLARVEVPQKVTGAAKYGMDVQVPGMVYAAVLQSPYPSSATRSRGRRPPRTCSRSPGRTRRAPITTASARSRSSRRSGATRVAPASALLTKAISKVRWRAPPRCIGASIAPATSITPRWSR